MGDRSPRAMISERLGGSEPVFLAPFVVPFCSPVSATESKDGCSSPDSRQVVSRCVSDNESAPNRPIRLTCSRALTRCQEQGVETLRNTVSVPPGPLTVSCATCGPSVYVIATLDDVYVVPSMFHV